MTRTSSLPETSPASTGRSRSRWAPALLSAAALAGCSSAPLSFINDGSVYHRQVLNRFPVRVVAVDGTYTAFQPVPISPGTHSLLIAAAPVAGFHMPREKTYSMTIAPCTRYYIAAQRKSPLLQDWDLVVEDSYPVAGCNPATELQKAKALANSAAAPLQGTSMLQTTDPSTLARNTLR